MEHVHIMKLLVPQIAANVIDRPRLFEYSQTKRITAIYAPAGYGKTTFTSQLIKHHNLPTAWLSIDQLDNDVNRFLTYLFSSIANAIKGSSACELNKLIAQLEEIPNLNIILDLFLNELSQISHPLTIVLDDVHLISSEVIFETLTKMIEFSPLHISFIIIARNEPALPLARWRANQILQEITQEQLKFTYEETDAYLASFNFSGLSYSDIQTIHEQAEGWVTGLLLMQLASSITDESTSHKYIVDFLWHEIIYNLKPSMQHFLMVTSLLEELDPSICNDLAERTDSYEILESFVKKGLFTVRLETKKPLYRYHHLFAETLRNEFLKNYSNEQVIEIVETAMALLYEDGKKIAAIELAMQYKLYDQALQWMEKEINVLSHPRFIELYLKWLKQIKNNVNFVPYEILLVGLSHSITALDKELIYAISEELDQRQLIFRWMDEPINAKSAQAYNRLKAYALIATRGSLKQALELLLLNQEKRSSNPSASSNSLLMVYNTYEHELLRTSLARKGILPSPTESEEILNVFQKTAYINYHVSGFITGIAAEVFYEKFQDEQSSVQMEKAIEYGYLYNDMSLLVPMYLLKTKKLLNEQQFTVAHSTLLAIQSLTTDKHWFTMIEIMKAYCYIEEGKLSIAEQLLNTTKSTQVFWKVVYIRLLIKQKKYEQALSHSIQLKAIAKQEQQISTFIRATIYEAICHFQLNNANYALEKLDEVFLVASKNYYLRTIIEESEADSLLDLYLENLELEKNNDYFTELQKQFYKKKKALTNLSAREIKLLEALANGCTFKNLSETFGLSAGTIRVYASKLYQKIGVSNKKEAVAFYNHSFKTV